ncbi:hypothetical protein LINPERHAP1_LOCUS984 [Linum perenne]
MDYFVGLERIDYNKFNEDQARVAKEVALDLKSKASPTIEYIVI